MSGTLIQMTGLAGSLPRISSITSGRVPAFWGSGQNMNSKTFSPPLRWSTPGSLLRRPRVAFVGTAWPSGPLSSTATGLLKLTTLSPLADMVFNAHDSINVDQLIAQKPWFPRMAVRIFTPTPPEFTGSTSALQPGEATVYAKLVSINGAWNSTLQAAVPELQAAGIDAQIVGTEADVTVEVVGKLIADHFHLS